MGNTKKMKINDLAHLANRAEVLFFDRRCDQKIPAKLYTTEMSKILHRLNLQLNILANKIKTGE